MGLGLVIEIVSMGHRMMSLVQRDFSYPFGHFPRHWLMEWEISIRMGLLQKRVLLGDFHSFVSFIRVRDLSPVLGSKH